MPDRDQIIAMRRDLLSPGHEHIAERLAAFMETGKSKAEDAVSRAEAYATNRQEYVQRVRNILASLPAGASAKERAAWEREIRSAEGEVQGGQSAITEARQHYDRFQTMFEKSQQRRGGAASVSVEA
ncbi:MAG TPA: hypothetical protein VGU45_02320 [Microvirga sp.]|nr:hypothetical protein [Microvirga sp.]